MEHDFSLTFPLKNRFYLQKTNSDNVVNVFGDNLVTLSDGEGQFKMGRTMYIGGCLETKKKKTIIYTTSHMDAYRRY
ncbi:hypothetical protein HA402_009509 [Bradysia odoriphaga]|nr:hypothetical protein HA402_009509 [Bradysia odoriphaga]